MNKHSIDIRVYYEDTDAGGFVYYANYLKFAERGRTELLRSLGFENKSLMDQTGKGFVVRRIEAQYNKPALLDDLLRLETRAIDVKNASVILRQDLLRGSEEIFSSKVTLACIDLRSGAPVRFPSGLKAGFEYFLQSNEQKA